MNEFLWKNEVRDLQKQCDRMNKQIHENDTKRKQEEGKHNSLHKENERLSSRIVKTSMDALEWRCETRRLKRDVQCLQSKIDDMKERKKKGDRNRTRHKY